MWSDHELCMPSLLDCPLPSELSIHSSWNTSGWPINAYLIELKQNIFIISSSQFYLMMQLRTGY